MESQPKTHLIIQNKYHLICHPDIVGDRQKIGDDLAFEANKLPETFILSPKILDPKGFIFFHGGDFLPHSHVPMPFAYGEDDIGQYPGIREVGFSPLFCALISDDLYATLKPPVYFDDDILAQADFVMEAKALGARCYATPLVSVTYPHAFAPKQGAKKFLSRFHDWFNLFDKKWADTLDKRFRLPVAIQACVAFSGGYNLHALADCVQVHVETLAGLA